MKVILLTGATDGIGHAAAVEFGRRGCHVLVHGRSIEKCEAVADEVKQAGGRASVFTADLSSMDAVRHFADQAAALDRIDVLVNNAGVYMNEKKITSDGFETTFAVNHLAHFLLTARLFPLLEKSRPARVISVSSIAHNRAYIDFENLNAEKSFEPYASYANSKLANVLFANELARRAAGHGVVSNSLHPGVITTKLLTKGFPTAKGTGLSEGIRAIVHLASEADGEKTTGQYYVNETASSPSPSALDPVLAKKLWDKSEELLRRWL